MSSPEYGFTRREFFTRAGKIAVASTAVLGTVGAAGFPIIRNEIAKGKDGIVRVSEGNFIPLYERHDVGISTENFPQDINAIFRESPYKLKYMQQSFTYSPQSYGRLINPSPDPKTNVDEITSNLSRRNAPFVFGDAHRDINSAIVGLNEILAGIFAIRAINKYSINDVPHDPTRRKLLKLALGIVAFFGLSNITYLIPLLTGNIENPEWLMRINRINGIISHMHPEQPMVFLRNAIMANKLLLTGKYLKEKLGRQPNIAFWVGAGHSGIEDFLQLGQEACRKAITLYPKFYLEYVIDGNGGAEDFSSALLAYPRATGENQYAFDLVKITDQKLLERLNS